MNGISGSSFLLSGNPGNLAGLGDPRVSPQPASSSPRLEPAPVNLTPPASPQSRDSGSPTARQDNADGIRRAMQGPAHPGPVPVRLQVARGRLEEASARLNEAQQAGVDVAKCTFFKKAFNVGISAIAVGLAATLTAGSFGGAAPLLALACVNFAVSTGDAYCAFRNMRNAQAQAEGRNPPYAKLPMGNDSIQNVIHKCLTFCNVSEEKAKFGAQLGGGAIRLGLFVSTLAVGAGLATPPQAIELTDKISSAVATGVTALSEFYALRTDPSDHQDLQDAANEIRGLVDGALNLVEEQRIQLDNDGPLNVDRTQAEVDALRAEAEGIREEVDDLIDRYREAIADASRWPDRARSLAEGVGRAAEWFAPLRGGSALFPENIELRLDFA